MTATPSLAATRNATLAAACAFALLGLLAQRNGVRLSFDSYYYVEYAKEFRHHLPGSFGTAWPFGWPLLGSLAGLAGLSAYHGLLAWSVLSVAGSFCLGRLLLPWPSLGLLGGTLLLTATGTFAQAAIVAGVLSETSFACVLLAMAYHFGRWPEPRAIALSAALAVLAFCLRYAGGLALVLYFAWVFSRWASLREAGRVPLALLAGAAACTVAAALLAWNFVAVGGIVSHHPKIMPAPSAWLGVAADFGWSFPAVLGGSGLMRVLGFGTLARTPLGLVLACAMIALGAVAWRRGATAAIRSLGLLVCGYSVGLIALRCLNHFDGLYSARMALPVLLPSFILIGWMFPAPKFVAAIFAAVLALNLGLAVRGGSREIGGNVQAAVAIVSSARADDLIAINDTAFSLSACLDQPVIRAPGLDDPRWRTVRFAVIAAVPLDRDSKQTAFAVADRELATALVAKGRFLERLHTPELIVLESVPIAR